MASLVPDSGLGSQSRAPRPLSSAGGAQSLLLEACALGFRTRPSRVLCLLPWPRSPRSPCRVLGCLFLLCSLLADRVQAQACRFLPDTLTTSPRLQPGPPPPTAGVSLGRCRNQTLSPDLLPGPPPPPAPGNGSFSLLDAQAEVPGAHPSTLSHTHVQPAGDPVASARAVPGLEPLPPLPLSLGPRHSPRDVLCILFCLSI